MHTQILLKRSMPAASDENEVVSEGSKILLVYCTMFVRSKKSPVPHVVSAKVSVPVHGIRVETTVYYCVIAEAATRRTRKIAIVLRTYCARFLNDLS